MTKKQHIGLPAGDGYDRAHWIDGAGRAQAVRVLDAASVRDMSPTGRTRPIYKWTGMTNYHGHYWVSSTGRHVWHESMAEYSVMMLMDHLHSPTNALSQPLLVTFADGSHHTPDYLLDTPSGGRLLVDVHPKARTTKEHAKSFEQTRRLCEGVGWGYYLFDSLNRVAVWNLEMFARYRHPRYAPKAEVAETILALANKVETFGELRAALKTDKPGEAIPYIYHLMWRRHIQFNLSRPFRDHSPIWVGNQISN
ncbi:TnsA-like heteromeric transposase endonuclease subunit [Microbacterium sp. W1N]|uniref:TnsA-like heteromeric transposase endonuclease subunit n=1 Tax=Microbacterium festucae TaxID=2977531 RepID=UPI0021C166AC|nr:TnsA-like heteromeric transposase endonuclease subunit [Microbacterium festucae]MCT9819298.1 TnsA-like heteromeric transposase endonuclease subunit [Microbacterium festucae]